MEKIIKTISDLAPFLASYPSWLKVLFSIWIFLGAVLFVGFVLAKQQSPSTDKQQSNNINNTITEENKLIIRGVKAYEFQNESVKVKVIATVNGIKYVYPSGTKAEWLEIGKNMSAQSFILPPTKNSYDISFTMVTLHEGKEIEMISQWVESIKNLPFNGEYELHAYHPASKTRSGNVSASILYEIIKQ
jgi:hypothetical protein